MYCTWLSQFSDKDCWFLLSWLTSRWLTKRVAPYYEPKSKASVLPLISPISVVPGMKREAEHAVHQLLCLHLPRDSSSSSSGRPPAAPSLLPATSPWLAARAPIGASVRQRIAGWLMLPLRPLIKAQKRRLSLIERHRQGGVGANGKGKRSICMRLHFKVM